MVCIELCAGSGKLSGALKSFGFTTLAIDHSRNRHNQRHPTVCVDLADDESVELVLKLSEGQGQMLFYIHAAPPFGTVRTRERRDSSKRKRRGAPEQKPLRSSKFPEGLPSLSGADLAGVSTANKIFQNVCKILNAFKDVALISIENPRHSYMWDTIWLKQLISDAKLFPVDYQQCMQGGDKDKWTRFFCNHAAFSVLARECDRRHHHKPWKLEELEDAGVFHAAAESEYPDVLCKNVSNLIAGVANDLGVVMQSHNKRAKRTILSKVRAAEAGRQPRGNLLPQILSEFKYVATVDPAVVQSLTPGLLTPNQCQMLSCRFPAKLLPVKLGEDGAEVHQIGVFRTPNEFVNEALGLNHPFDCSSSISDDAKRAIFALFTEGPSGIKAMRNEAFDFYESLGARLEAEEQALHAGLDANRASILNGKKLLIFDRLCKDAGVEDQALLALMLNGTRLTGEAGYTGLFSTEVTSAAMSECQLMQSSKWTRRKILGKGLKTSDIEVRHIVWENALSERDKGWLRGPYTEEQLKQELGPLFVISRRFGLSQSDKIRAIDDMSESLINASYSSTYRLDLPGIDGVSVLARTLLDSVSDSGFVSLGLSDGSVLRGKLHESLTVESSRRIVGRTLDLDAAYKQMLVAKESLWCSVIAVEDNNGDKQLFVSDVLPFGASASVFAFNRLARALQLIGERLFGLIWLNYFDDYPQLDIAASGSDAQHAAERLFDLVGWRFSTKDSKRQPIASTFDVLGVSFDFKDCPRGRFVVKNKKARIEQVVSEIDDVLRSGEWSSHRATSLRGKLQFAETHTYGRALSAHLRCFQQRASGKLLGTSIPETLRLELLWARSFMLEDRPRVLHSGTGNRKLIVFTDASLEDHDNSAGIGMVAFACIDDLITEKFFFSEKVPVDLLNAWQKNTKKVIATLELFAALTAICMLSTRFQGWRIFAYVDNEAARSSMISLYSPLLVNNNMLKALSEVSMAYSLFVWTARVPSASNPSDAPSRGKYDHLVSEGFQALIVSWPKADRF